MLIQEYKYRVKNYFNCCDLLQYPILNSRGENGWNQTIEKQTQTLEKVVDTVMTIVNTSSINQIFTSAITVIKSEDKGNKQKI